MSSPDCCAGLTDPIDISFCNFFRDKDPTDLYSPLNEIKIENQKNIFPVLSQCLKNRITDADKPLIDLINNYENKKKDAITASEMNKNTMALYQVDLYYTIGKILLFAILVLAYFHFLNGATLIESMKTGIQSVKEKVATLTK